MRLVVAGDVTNPLLGPDGAAAIYGPQKGAGPDDIAYLEQGLTNVARVIARQTVPHGFTLALTPGGGAAGGAGFAATLLGASMTSGADHLLDLLHFDSRVTDSDIVLTGEGTIDEQTQSGKLLSAVARRAHRTPVIAVAGRCTLPQTEWRAAGFTEVRTLSEFTARSTVDDPHHSAEVLTWIGHDIGRRLVVI